MRSTLALAAAPALQMYTNLSSLQFTAAAWKHTAGWNQSSILCPKETMRTHSVVATGYLLEGPLPVPGFSTTTVQTSGIQWCGVQGSFCRCLAGQRVAFCWYCS